MTSRPKMHARDSSGRNVSLLNDEPAAQTESLPFRNPSFSTHDLSSIVRSNSAASAQSRTSSPYEPELVRADSFDSSNTHDPHSPMTPTSMREFAQHNPYAVYKNQSQYEYRDGLPRMEDFSSGHQYPMPGANSYTSQQISYAEPPMYAEETYVHRNNGPPERGPKRYPCRHRETHGCDKTFTTSGHASRHSKIHTAEKGVVCTWKGCQKKFTRGDNMKQHLETHTKERSRSSTSHKNTTIRTLTVPGGVRKPSVVDHRTSRPASRNTEPQVDSIPVDPALFGDQPMSSPFAAPFAQSYYPAPISPRHENYPNNLDFLAEAALTQSPP